MKLAVTLAKSQHGMIVQLAQLDDALGDLLEYVEKQENAATAAGKTADADKLVDLETHIEECRGNVQSDELRIIEDSPALKKALSQISQANKQIAGAIKQTKDLDATLKTVASILDLVAKGLSVFA